MTERSARLPLGGARLDSAPQKLEEGASDRSGGDHGDLHPGDRPGHDLLARHPVPRGPHRRRLCAEGVRAALSGLRLGRARAGGSLGHRRRDLPPCHGESRRVSRGHRRDRHYQPARDDARLGPRDGRADPPRHRLAGPPYRRYLRRHEGRGPGGDRRGADRAAARPLFLRHQGRLDPRQCSGRARARRGRGARLRHGRHLPPVAADRRARSTRPTRPTPRARCSSTSTRGAGATRSCISSAFRGRCCREVLDSSADFGTTEPGAARRRRSGSAASPATSRRRPSARPASSRA